MTEQVTHKRLSSGLQSFTEASPEYELAPLGIASMHDQAQRLAEYGRNGDIYVIHAAEGETVIPMEVLDANPQIKQLLFSQMKEMGLDPQEFVVGNELNSINPVTGLPEFFFKSIFRSVKKAVKKVFKVAKKLAPVIIPLAASAFGFPFLGTAFKAGSFGAAALGSGLGSLAGGGNLKDAFKSALIGGGISTLGSGLARGFGATGDQGFGEQFMAGVGESLSPTAGVRTPLGELYKEKLGVPDIWPDEMYENVSLENLENAALAEVRGKVPPTTFKVRGGSGLQNTAVVHEPVVPSDAWRVNRVRVRHDPQPTVTQPTVTQPIIGRSEVEKFLPSSRLLRTGQQAGPTVKDMSIVSDAIKKAQAADSGWKARIFGRQKPSLEAVAQELRRVTGGSKILSNPSMLKPIQDAIAASGAGAVRQYAPLALAGAGAAYAGGMFDPPKVEEVPEDPRLTALSGPSGADLVAADPSKYQIPADPLTYADQLRTGQGILQPSIYASHGGMIQGPGTGTSDDIPGWLSDGEFVLTEKAVRGADPSGRGDRMAGADNLYSIMRDFEMRA